MNSNQTTEPIDTNQQSLVSVQSMNNVELSQLSRDIQEERRKRIEAFNVEQNQHYVGKCFVKIGGIPKHMKITGLDARGKPVGFFFQGDANGGRMEYGSTDVVGCLYSTSEIDHAQFDEAWNQFQQCLKESMSS